MLVRRLCKNLFSALGQNPSAAGSDGQTLTILGQSGERCQLRTQENHKHNEKLSADEKSFHIDTIIGSCEFQSSNTTNKLPPECFVCWKAASFHLQNGHLRIPRDKFSNNWVTLKLMKSLHYAKCISDR